MQNLLQLPKELLEEIASNVDRNDIENYVLTCKTIFDQSKKLLYAHRYRMRFTKVNLRPWFGSPAWNPTFTQCHPFHLLQKLLEDSELATYIEVIIIEAQVFKGFRSDDDSGFPEAIGSPPQLQLLHAQIKEQIAPYVGRINGLIRSKMCHRSPDDEKASESSPEDDESYIEQHLGAIAYGHAGAIIGLILSLLPFLHEIKIKNYPGGYTILAAALWKICSCNISSTNALQRLSTASIDQGGSSGGLLISQALAALPNLLKFSAVDLGHVHSIQIIRSGPLISSLQEIDLSEDFHHSIDMNQLFGQVIHLRKVNFKIHTRPHQLMSWFPTNVVNWLSNGTFEMLEHVEFYWGDDRSKEYCCYSFELMRGLHKLKFIKILTIPTLAFRISRQEKRPYCDGRPLAMPLSDVLPLSLKRLVLTGPGDITTEASMFINPYSQRAELPNLEEVVFEYANPLTTSFLQRVVASGVRVVSQGKQI